MGSIYDNYQQAQTPYMSQFVGSIVPELNSYSATLQKRYDTAADTDDMLAEGLGNLQHLNFDTDTQYANELKQQYYQRLNDRASQGDFENMGRRTRLDAMRFAQAYQPLIQRQKDYAEIIKKVQSDPNISDPEKKQQILGYITHMNSTGRTDTGDFQRDGSGRVQLGGIQDWAYAPDVDINKKLVDILSKKEADIHQSGFASDGAGLKISSIQELRSPAVMARLARQLMDTDPEIKAMLNRDVTLQNYRLTPEQVAEQLKSSDVTPYQSLKRQGLNDHQIRTIAKQQGVDPRSLNTSLIQKQKQDLINQGATSEAADRSILNNITRQQMIEPHARFAGDLLSVDKQKLDAKEDGLFLLHAKHNMDQADQGSFQILTTPAETANAIDAGKISTDYINKSKGLKDVQSNVNAAVLQGLKKAGLTTGDPKKDLAMATEFSNDRTKLNALKDKLVSTDPDLAGRLETTQNNYLSSRDEVQNSSAMVKSMEENAGVNWDKFYDQYKNGKIPGIYAEGPLGKHPLSKDEFIEQMRNQDSPVRGMLHKLEGPSISLLLNDGSQRLKHAASYYDDLMRKGAAAVNGGTTRLDTYNSIEPTSSGYVKNATDLITDRVKLGAVRLKELGTGNDKEGTLADLMDLKKNKLGDKTSSDYKTMDATDIRLATRWNGGKPVIILRQPDGSSRALQVTNPEAIPMFREVQSRLIRQAMSNKTSDQAKGQAQDLLLGLGESTMNTSAHELAGYAPSSVRYPINNRFTVKVRAGGPFGKVYEVYTRDGDHLVQKFNTPDDIAIALGVDENNRISAPKK